MSGGKNWGDWAVWYDADRELQQEEHAQLLQEKFEESETNTRIMCIIDVIDSCGGFYECEHMLFCLKTW